MMASGTESAEPRSSLLERIGMYPPLFWGFPAVLLLMCACGVESGFLSVFLTERGISDTSVALVFTVYGATAAFASWLSGALSDLWGPKRVMLIGTVIWLVFHTAFLGLGVAANSYPLILIFYGLRGFGYPLFAYGFIVWIAAATPPKNLGTSLGWFWLAFAAGFPTFGSFLADRMIPFVGQLMTLWWALIFVVGAAIALFLVREPIGSKRLAPEGENPIKTLLASITIIWQIPKVGMGGIVRTINTAAQLGFFVFLPIYTTTTVGYTLSQWLRMLALLALSNMIWNLLFGIIGDKFGWRKTVALFGGMGCAVTTLALYYSLKAGPSFYVLAVIAGICYGACLSAYVPLGAIMAALAPDRKGAAMAILNLGAGASASLGPAVVALFFESKGAGVVMWIYAVLYVISAMLTWLMKVPEDPGEA